MKHSFKNVIIALYLPLFSIGAIAAELDNEEIHGEEEHGKHALAAFVSVTCEYDENHETLGLEYSYRITRTGHLRSFSDPRNLSAEYCGFNNWMQLIAGN